MPMLRILFLVCLGLVLPSCDETPSQGESPASSKTKDAGFDAAITGAYEGAVSGDGVLVLLPQAGFNKQGYFFLADGRGIRPHGVTFVLPRGLAPGKHQLNSPSALAIGTVPSVRVDRDMKDKVLSSGMNTTGFLDLTAFAGDASKLSGSLVAGSFEFETADANGRKITVKGKFSFKVK